MSTEDTIMKVGEPLKAHNWLPWKARILSIAAAKKLTKYLEGTEQRPTYADATKPTAEETTALNTWQENDNKARSLLYCNISDGEMMPVLSATTASDIWRKLKAAKEPNTGISKLTARRKLYRTVAEDGMDIAEHIKTMQLIHQELSLMGVEITDQEFLDILMTSLPESWDNFTNTYATANASGIQKITTDEFIAAINDELRRRNDRATTSDTALKAYAPNAKPASGTRRGAKSAKSKCENCGRPNHTKENCWSKGGGKEGQSPWKKKAKRDTANKAEDDGSDIDVAYMAHEDFVPPEDGSRHAWWLDSCANQHVCVNKSLFTSYTKQWDRMIGGIGGKRTVMGIGTIVLKFRVGDKII
jgi:hypothetical protein